MISETLERERPTTALVMNILALRQKLTALLPTPAVFGLVLGPLTALVLWGLPLGLQPDSTRLTPKSQLSSIVLFH